MHSLISIVGVVLFGKENYHEWSRKIKHTLIYNELWGGVVWERGYMGEVLIGQDLYIIVAELYYSMGFYGRVI